MSPLLPSPLLLLYRVTWWTHSNRVDIRELDEHLFSACVSFFIISYWGRRESEVHAQEWDQQVLLAKSTGWYQLGHGWPDCVPDDTATAFKQKVCPAGEDGVDFLRKTHGLLISALGGVGRCYCYWKCLQIGMVMWLLNLL